MNQAANAATITPGKPVDVSAGNIIATLGRHSSSISFALLLGFSAIFGLWLTWTYQLVQNLGHIQRNVETLQQNYVHGEETLSRVRTNVLLGSIYLRDALIDSASSRREYYRGELTRLRDEIEALLAAHLANVSASERDRWAPLHQELSDYWSSRDVAFTDSTRTPIEGTPRRSMTSGSRKRCERTSGGSPSAPVFAPSWWQRSRTDYRSRSKHPCIESFRKR